MIYGFSPSRRVGIGHRTACTAQAVIPPASMDQEPFSPIALAGDMREVLER